MNWARWSQKHQSSGAQEESTCTPTTSRTYNMPFSHHTPQNTQKSLNFTHKVPQQSAKTSQYGNTQSTTHAKITSSHILYKTQSPYSTSNIAVTSPLSSRTNTHTTTTTLYTTAPLPQPNTSTPPYANGTQTQTYHFSSYSPTNLKST